MFIYRSSYSSRDPIKAYEHCLTKKLIIRRVLKRVLIQGPERVRWITDIGLNFGKQNLSGGTLGYEHPNSRHIVWKRWQRTALYRRQSRIWITIYEIRPVKIRFIPAILIERVPNNLEPLRTYIYSYAWLLPRKWENPIIDIFNAPKSIYV